MNKTEILKILESAADKNDDVPMRLVRLAFEKIQEQGRIPVSERLPKEDDYKSCIECLDGAVWYFTENGTMGLGYYCESTKEWSTIYDLKTDGKVVAWMPLPEPYKPPTRSQYRRMQEQKGEQK